MRNTAGLMVLLLLLSAIAAADESAHGRDYILEVLFADGFESGTTVAWSGTGP